MLLGKSYKNVLNFDLFVDIERNFIMSPPSARVEPGFSLEIKCTLPSATPPAVRSWLKNGQKVEQSSQVTITNDGKLIIHSAKVQDSGNYSCVAKNIVARKISNPGKKRFDVRFCELSFVQLCDPLS
jgi:Immunoglobulin I-set domain